MDSRIERKVNFLQQGKEVGIDCYMLSFSAVDHDGNCFVPIYSIECRKGPRGKIINIRPFLFKFEMYYNSLFFYLFSYNRGLIS